MSAKADDVPKDTDALLSLDRIYEALCIPAVLINGDSSRLVRMATCSDDRLEWREQLLLN